MDDDDLVLAVLGGDQRAWRQLGPRLRKVIRPCFLRFFGEADADDLVQSTLVIIHRKLPEFEVRAGKPIRKWARTIARSQVQDELRRRARRAKLMNSLANAPRPPTTKLSTRLGRAQAYVLELERVREALPMLDSRYRRVIENDLEGGDIDEFAAREQIERGTVRTRRRRAYQILRQLVRELGDSTPSQSKF
ncbi:MAG: sigma-70 family RNA polymerase sigma factor [Enhygromyxa sp.]